MQLSIKEQSRFRNINSRRRQAQRAAGSLQATTARDALLLAQPPLRNHASRNIRRECLHLYIIIFCSAVCGRRLAFTHRRDRADIDREREAARLYI
ncbi:hypothetical protein T492DRAFT_952163 [Pavlovales sp. CCMP2436]|nr:hypothetical protein T492DRAFT_952163 [Pavlovales sp. CCMP2436]